MNTKEYRSESARGINAALQSVDENKIEETVKAVEDAKRVFFTGAGRSFLMTKAIAMAMMQIGITVYATGEVCTPSISEGDLLVAASCSGETQSVLLFVEQAKKRGAKIALITGNADSSMGKLADIILEMDPMSEEGSVQKTWVVDNRFEQAIVPLGDCFVEYLARRKGASHETIGSNHANME